jgi:hypothetical protein
LRPDDNSKAPGLFGRRYLSRLIVGVFGHFRGIEEGPGTSEDALLAHALPAAAWRRAVNVGLVVGIRLKARWCMHGNKMACAGGRCGLELRPEYRFP